jgi:phosphatidate phosphatase PAH1
MRSLMAIGLAACSASSLSTTNPGGKADGWGVELQECHDGFTPADPTGWRHSIESPIVTALGDAHHAIWDAFGANSTSITVRAQMQYSKIGKALEDEGVHLYLDECDGWHDQGRAITDGEGVANLKVADSLAPGIYDAAVEVEGDATFAKGAIWVLPAGTHIVVYDIDGTLTTSDAQIILQSLASLIDGSYTPAAYPAATDLTWAHRGLSEVGVYLTGRPSLLDGATRDWLAGQGFAEGIVHVTTSASQVLPTNGGVGSFKLAFLQKLEAAGYVLDYTYGNATTDIWAYSNAGVDVSNQWIIGTHAGEQGTNAETDTWQPRVDEVGTLGAVSQPFSW